MVYVRGGCGVCCAVGRTQLKNPKWIEGGVGDCADGVGVVVSLFKHVYDGLSLQPPCWTVEGGVGGN